MEYKKAYEELKNFVLNLSPYCDTCGTVNCDECNRKSFYWSMNPSIIEGIEERNNISEKEGN